MSLVCSCSDKLFLIGFQSAFLVTADAGALPRGVGCRFCCGWLLSAVACTVWLVEWALVALGYLCTLRRYSCLECSALVPRFAPSNFSDLMAISLNVISSVKWGVMNHLITSKMLFKIFLRLTSSVMDLPSCLSISSLWMSSYGLAKGWTPICLPTWLGVMVCHSYNRRFLLMAGIRNFGRASMNLKQIWSFSCFSRSNWL